MWANKVTITFYWLSLKVRTPLPKPICPSGKILLSKSQNQFFQMAKCICPNGEMQVSKWPNVLVQMVEYICPNGIEYTKWSQSSIGSCSRCEQACASNLSKHNTLLLLFPCKSRMVGERNLEMELHKLHRWMLQRLLLHDQALSVPRILTFDSGSARKAL